VEALSGPNDDFHIHARELYWLSRVPFGESKVAGPSLERILGMPATSRSIVSLRKLAARCGDRVA
jgi:hypothetical protein